MVSLARQRPPSPAVVGAATAIDGSGPARQSVAVRRRPRLPVNLIAAMAFRYSSPCSSWRWRRLRRNPFRKKEKAEKVNFYLWHNFKKNEICSEARSGTIAHKNKKRITAVTQYKHETQHVGQLISLKGHII